MKPKLEAAPRDQETPNWRLDEQQWAEYCASFHGKFESDEEDESSEQ